MSQVKNYGLSGVGNDVEIGKRGPRISAPDAGNLKITRNDGTTLANLSGAEATQESHFVTKSQLTSFYQDTASQIDGLYTEATFVANLSYDSDPVISLGVISAGTKTVITSFQVDTAFNGVPSVSVGHTADPEYIMGSDFNDPSRLETFQVLDVLTFDQDTEINVYYTNDGFAAAGTGLVMVSVVDGAVISGTTITVNEQVVQSGGSSNVAVLADLTDVNINVPAENQVLTYDGTNWINSTSIANTPFFEMDSNYTLSASESVIVDTTSASIVLTLPLNPTLGDEIRIIDGSFNAATNNIVIVRNGSNIEGEANDMTIDVDGAAFGLVYYNATRGWILTER